MTAARKDRHGRRGDGGLTLAIGFVLAACFILVATGGCETVGRTIFAAVDECREACLDLPPGKVSRCLEDCGDEDSPPDTTEVSP